MLNQYIYTLASTAISMSLLALFVFFKDFRKLTHITFSLYYLSVAWWSAGECMIITATNQESAMGWAKFYNAGVAFIPTFFIHFVHSLMNDEQRRKNKSVLIMAYVFSLIYLIMTLQTHSSIFIKDVMPRFSFNYFMVPGLLYPIFFIAWGGLATYGLLALYRVYRTSRGEKGRRLTYFFWTMAIAYIGAAPNYLPVFGIEIPYLNPYGTYAIPALAFVTAYAILKHGLMDIHVVLQKGFVYSFLITVITLIYLISIRSLEYFFKNILGYHSIWGSMSIVMVIAVLFNPLKNKIQTFVEKSIFKGTTLEIAKQNEMLRLQVAQADRYKTLAALTSSIITEIGKPLKVLKESDEELEQKQNDPTFMRTYAQREKEEIEKVNTLLEHLTNYSNPEEVVAQDTPIHKLLNETIGMMKAGLTEKNIKLVKEFKATGDLMLNVDPSQIRQALSNIIVNAIEAMAEGGKLYLKTTEEDGILTIMIKDTGEGIKEEDISRIYDPFFSRKEGHAGLGLSVTRGIIENHQGKIRVRTEPGFGTELVVELPIVKG